MVILIILVFAGIALTLAPKLYKERKIRELTIAGLVLLAGFVLNILYNANVKIPSPITAFKALFDMIHLHY